MKFKETEPYIENTLFVTVPLVVHGNGPAKKVLNSLGNYLAKAWNTEDQVRVKDWGLVQNILNDYLMIILKVVVP